MGQSNVTRICLFGLSTIPSTQPSGIEKLLPRLSKESWASWAHASAWRREVGGLYRVLKTSSYWAPPTCATLAPLEEKVLPPKNLHQDWLRGSACETPTHVPIVPMGIQGRWHVHALDFKSVIHLFWKQFLGMRSAMSDTQYIFKVIKQHLLRVLVAI